MTKLTDAELDAAIERALDAAHNAPFSKYSMDHRGHTSFEHGYSYAWRDSANEWLRLSTIREARRALLEESRDA